MSHDEFEPAGFLIGQNGEKSHVLLTVAYYERLLKGLSAEKSPRPTHIPNLEPAVGEEEFTYFQPGKGTDARAYFRNPIMFVLKGSVCGEPETATMPERYRLLRHWLIDKEIIQRIQNKLVFNHDHAFNNSSEAVCVLEGGSRSGYDSWRNSSNQTLGDLGHSRA